MNARKQWMIRLALSLAFGVAVMGVPLYLVLGDASARRFDSSSLSTTSRILKIDSALEEYKVRQGSYPKNLQAANLSARDGWDIHCFTRCPRARRSLNRWDETESAAVWAETRIYPIAI